MILYDDEDGQGMKRGEMLAIIIIDVCMGSDVK
jgi:hypothetical protein